LGNCAACHTARGGEPYAGGRPIETPFGTIFSSNITPNKQAGIGQWNAQDFWRAMHHGESKDGHLLYPAFPYTSYTHVTREDSDVIFGYLQTVQASAQANMPHALRWPFSTQTALAVWRTLNFSPAETATTPPPSGAADEASKRRRGAYLVQGLGHCEQCHSPRNFVGGIKDTNAFSGGTLATDQWYAPSLLDVNEASVSQWDRAQIVALLKTGSALQGQANGPMAEVVLHSTQYLSNEDADAVAAYLKALPITGKTTEGTVKTLQTRLTPKGEKLYETHCAECHGKTGMGQEGAYPALANNRVVNRTDVHNLVQIVLHGGFAPATQGNPRPFGMPPFMLQLSDPELAALLSYVRGSWGNTGSAVSEFDINRARKPQQP
jgi:mono/diheme cytochrome c family protein